MKLLRFTFVMLTVTFSTIKLYALEKEQMRAGQRYFVSNFFLNVRSAPTTAEKNIVGVLNLNDVVELVSPLGKETSFVQIRILSSTGNSFDSQKSFYIAKEYINDQPMISNASKYFVIQNVASEKTRVYERCTAQPNCPHKLVMETDMVVGRNEEGTKENRYAYMTWLGHSKIAEWVKFYSDGNQAYPSWYSPNQDMKTIPPAITDSPTSLLGSRKWIVKGADGKDTIYGAFGWYAAKLSPADETNGVNYQWMHGTIGWGKDGNQTIDVTRGILINIFSNPGSHGCTRLENRAVAFLRSFLAPGTDVYRIYARESTREKETISGFFKKKVSPLPRYAENYNNPAKWNFILLTDGAKQSNGLTADARVVIANGIQVIPGTNLLDQGVYDVDQYPNPAQLDYRYTAATGKSGDRYRIDSGQEKDFPKTNFKGYFLVDEGRFIDYHHPDEATVKGKVHVSGLMDFTQTVPEYLMTAGTHNPPEVLFPKDSSDR